MRPRRSSQWVLKVGKVFGRPSATGALQLRESSQVVAVAARAHAAARDDYVLLGSLEPGRDTAHQLELERECILDRRVRRRMSLVWEAGGSLSDHKNASDHNVVDLALWCDGRGRETGHRATNAEGTGSCRVGNDCDGESRP